MYFVAEVVCGEMRIPVHRFVLCAASPVMEMELRALGTEMGCPVVYDVPAVFLVARAANGTGRQRFVALWKTRARFPAV